jgi:hypothetical protein
VPESCIWISGSVECHYVIQAACTNGHPSTQLGPCQIAYVLTLRKREEFVNYVFLHQISRQLSYVRRVIMDRFPISTFLNKPSGMPLLAYKAYQKVCSFEVFCRSYTTSPGFDCCHWWRVKVWKLKQLPKL